MPVVPSYDSKIQDQPLKAPTLAQPASVANLGSSAEGVFRAAEGLSNTVSKIASEEKKNADDLMVLKSGRDLSILETTLLHDPDQGALNKQGADAFNLYDQVSEGFQKGADRIAEGLQNDQQREAYARMRYSHEADIYKQVEVHTSREIQKYDDTLTNSFIANEQQAAVENYMDPERVNQSLERQRSAIINHANRNGLPAEWIEEKTTAVASATHKDVLTRMVNNNQDVGAKAYFDHFKDSFTPNDLNFAEKLVEEGSLRVQSQRKSQEIVSGATSMTDALTKAREVPEGKLRDEVITRVKNDFASMDAARRMDQENLFTEVSKQVEQVKSRDQIPVEQWLALSPQDRSSIDARVAQLRKGVEPESGGETYYHLRNLASYAETRGDFKDMNLIPLRHKMTGSEFEGLVDLQAGLRNGKDETDKILNGIRSDTQIVDGVLRDIGLDPSPKEGSGAATKVNEFRKLVDERVLQHQAGTKKKITTPEMQQIVNDLGREVILDKGFFWDTKKRAYDVNVKDIPKADRVKVENALRASKAPITDANILRLYLMVNK